jgi:heparan-alpha-glucosaminide N-acetyltransferase
VARSAEAADSAAVSSYSPAEPAKVQRSLALDAYRGLIMLMLVSHGFGFGELKKHPVYGVVARQLGHAAWQGAALWDLGQPAFLFIVGAAMPFALAVRRQRGASFSATARRVTARALKLFLLSQVLNAVSSNRLEFQLIHVLSQIAFTYFLTFWILQLRWRWQAAAAAGLLILHSALFFLFPGPDGPFSREGNIGAVIDKALLGYNYSGYYVTINFLTSTVTTLAGAWTGLLLMSSRSNRRKALWLAAAAAAAFLMSAALEPFIPNVRRIWTATFTLFSAGWVLLMMLAIFLICEVLQWRRWTFPLVVIGMNSIFIYSVYMVLGEWLDRSIRVFTGGFTFIGDLAPVAQACAVLAAMWYLNYWLYRRKIFLKV